MNSRNALRFLSILASAALLSRSVAAQSNSPYLEDLTWPEVQQAIKAGKTTAIIYTGGTEQNGPHMAIGKHNFLARYIAGAIAIKLGDALVYPVLPFSVAGDAEKKTGHMRFPGSVSLTPASYHSVLHDVALSAAVAGFRNVVLMGDHGDGQNVIADVARELDAQFQGKGVRVFYIPDVYVKAKKESRAYEAAHGIRNDVHAGTDDTSELMAIDAQHRWIRAGKLAASSGRQTLVTGVNGDPTKATPELGLIFIGYKIDAGVAQIRSLARAH
jgi:creatinine amidohydrolase